MAVFEALEPDDPRHIGRYRLAARIGAGGMGRVYLARSPGERLFAVKVVRPDLAQDGDFRRRFTREVAAARRVSGAFTAGVVDADPQGSPPWLATVYVPGVSLDEAVAGCGPWPARPVFALGAGLAEALEAIHSAGIVHRDLKPSNVLLAADGPRVIDFGISAASEASALTRTGMVIGTPGFMSPEQLTGRPVGPASDVFALGAVLAYTATGTGPFGSGAPLALHYRAVHEQPDLAPLPPELRAVVAACLAKQPDRRPAVAALLDLLAAAGGAGGAGRATAAASLLLTEPGWMPDQVARLIREHAVRTSPSVTPMPTPTWANIGATAPPGPSPSPSVEPSVEPSVGPSVDPSAEPPAPPTAPAARKLHRVPTQRGRQPAPASAPDPPRTTRSRRPGLRLVALGAALLLVLVSGLYLLERKPWSHGAEARSVTRPGCDGSAYPVSWTRAGSTLACSSDGTTLRKLRSSNGRIAENNGELQFRLSDAPFPRHYELSVDVTGLTEADPTAEGGCAGFATHTGGAGTTFEELAVCPITADKGKIGVVKVLNGTEIDREEKDLPRGGAPYRLTADVTASTVTFSVAAASGESSTIQTATVASTTSYIGLTVFWKTAGARATFSNFRYQPR
ncbi:serine/threonine-protein kinase [Streptomyces sp. NPDC059063]|uniref:serine/threonine-protein kinase n=1 Tax=unclassified Streptomyces TaxID=2593676 RepID=UPI0036BAF89F